MWGRTTIQMLGDGAELSYTFGGIRQNLAKYYEKMFDSKNVEGLGELQQSG